jgi:hypothetical protein
MFSSIVQNVTAALAGSTPPYRYHPNDTRRIGVIPVSSPLCGYHLDHTVIVSIRPLSSRGSAPPLTQAERAKCIEAELDRPVREINGRTEWAWVREIRQRQRVERAGICPIPCPIEIEKCTNNGQEEDKLTPVFANSMAVLLNKNRRILEESEKA